MEAQEPNSPEVGFTFRSDGLYSVCIVNSESDEVEKTHHLCFSQAYQEICKFLDDPDFVGKGTLLSPSFLGSQRVVMSFVKNGKGHLIEQEDPCEDLLMNHINYLLYNHVRNLAISDGFRGLKRGKGGIEDLPGFKEAVDRVHCQIVELTAKASSKVYVPNKNIFRRRRNGK